MSAEKALLDCVADLYRMGLTTSVSGNHSIKYQKNWMWITPSGIPRYNLRKNDLVKVNLVTGKAAGRRRPSIEWRMHAAIYRQRPDINAIVHTHSPYTLAIAMFSKFTHIIEEAKIVVGDPVLVANAPSGSAELASLVSNSFKDPKVRAVVIRNHGVVAAGKDIDAARAVTESLEEWSKILAISLIISNGSLDAKNLLQ